MKILRRTLSFTLFAALVAGCVPKADQPVDVTSAYDAYGTAIMVEGAVPVQAVVADADSYVGRDVKLEGVISEVCQNAGCWLTMTDDAGTLVRVDVPRDVDGAYVYTFPLDIAGRRAIVAGRLARAEDAQHEHGDGGDEPGQEDSGEMAHEHAAEEGIAHSEQEAEVMQTATLALIADGALVERVRS